MLADILTYLSQTEAALFAELQASGAKLHRTPASGVWTPAQNALHLIATERWMYPMWGVMPKLGRWPGLLHAMDATNAALWRSLGMRTVEAPAERPSPGTASTAGRFIAPVFLRPATQPLPLAAIWDRRRHTRDRSLRAIHRVPESDLARLTWSHPLLGRYSLLEFVRFLGIHEERHTAQIRRTRP